MLPVGAIEKFHASYLGEPNSGCWLWDGASYSRGYAGLSYKGQHWIAHRFSYELHKGTIPQGLHIDHLCRVRCCVNPNHLEAVTKLVNTMRGYSPHAIHARKTHCPKGHPFEGSNLYLTSKGHRVCRTCRNKWSEKWRLKINPNPVQRGPGKIRCKRGHLFTEDNIYRTPSGTEQCRACRLLRRERERPRRRPS